MDNGEISEISKLSNKDLFDLFEGSVSGFPNIPDALISEKTRKEILRRMDSVQQLQQSNTEKDYMLQVYKQLLGPNATELSKVWDADGVTKVHVTWGPDADKITGEERAKILLSIIKGPMEIDTK